MIFAEDFLTELKKNKIDFFTGVPDSVLKNFTNKLDFKKNFKNLILTNEGSAVAASIGYYLSTNKIPAMYMQNSGLGNSLNPLISIAHKKVYQIPILLIIGWRGYGGMPNDAPEHWIMGEKSVNFFEMLDIPVIKFTNLEENSLVITTKINTTLDTFKKENLTKVLLFRKGVIN